MYDLHEQFLWEKLPGVNNDTASTPHLVGACTAQVPTWAPRAVRGPWVRFGNN